MNFRFIFVFSFIVSDISGQCNHVQSLPNDSRKTSIPSLLKCSEHALFEFRIIVKDIIENWALKIKKIKWNCNCNSNSLTNNGRFPSFSGFRAKNGFKRRQWSVAMFASMLLNWKTRKRWRGRKKHFQCYQFMCK